MTHPPFRSIITLYLLLLASAGCRQIQYHSQAPVQTTNQQVKTPTPSARRSLEQFAKDFHLTVVAKTRPYVMLRDGANTVFLFIGPDGRAFVNGRRVGSKGGITRHGETLYVAQAVAASVRSALRTQRPAKPPPIPFERPAAGACVVIDPGHGGKDPGAISVLGFYEKTVNLSVALELARRLTQRGLRVILTRESDVFIELDQRAGIANASGADLFVSIHADANANRATHGFTIYLCRSAPPSTRAAARAIEAAMAQTGRANRGIREADYRVLMKTGCPAVLVELGYLSNAGEAALLGKERFQDTLAHHLAEGICRFFDAARITL